MSSTPAFRVEEATIAELHQAIRDGRATCIDVVKQYIARARAYNGPSSLLVTKDGANIAPATGTVRAQAAIQFPTETVKASTLLPDLDKYEGKPLEFKDSDPDSQADRALQRLTGVVAQFFQESTPYLSLVHPMWRRHYGDYDHLARVKEWSRTGGVDDEMLE